MAGNTISTGGSVDIAISGLRAQRLRMKVVANNIANADTQKTETGKPYRRQDVVLGTSGSGSLSGVRILNVAGTGQLKSRKAKPGEDAGPDGMVQMTNVELPTEMIELVTASRAYQANAAVLKRHQESINTTLELLR